MGIILDVIGAIAEVATEVVKVAVDILKPVGEALMGLAKSLGLIKPETSVENLGDKAIQSEFNPEDFNSYTDYVKAVEEWDDLDPEKSSQIDENDKIRKGMELASGVTIERFDSLPIDEFCIAVMQNDSFFTEAKMQEIGKLFLVDSQYISSILNYVNGSEKDSMKIKEAINTLTTIEKAVNPNISDNEALKNVLDARK